MAGATRGLGFSLYKSAEQSKLDKGQVTGIRQGNEKGGEEEEVGVGHQSSWIQEKF